MLNPGMVPGQGKSGIRRHAVDNRHRLGHHDGDPTRHVKSWRSAWRTLTKKAGLSGFRFHDLRHCAITQLAENGTSDSTIMAIAGHVSRRMLERYSHVRMEAKWTAMEALAVSTKTAGYDTSRDTNAVPVNVRPA
jgi:integrase